MELASDSISFLNSPTCVPRSKGIPYKINELLKEFIDIVLDELPSKLPQVKDIQHAINLVSGSQLSNLLTIG